MEEQMIFGRKPVLEAMGDKMDRIYVQKGLKDGSIRKIIGRARDLNIDLQERDKSRLDQMTQGQNHQGVVAYRSNFRYASLEEMLAYAKSLDQDPVLLILDGIQDPHNLGAIIRSALVLGAHGVLIPKNRSASVNGTVYKTSAGAVDQMRVGQVTNLSRLVEDLKKRGIWTYGADLGGQPIDQTDLTGPLAIVVGSEGKGLSKKLGDHVDLKISIPMEGDFDSLNASVAASLILYEARRQGNGKKKKTL